MMRPFVDVIPDHLSFVSHDHGVESCREQARSCGARVSSGMGW